MTPDRIVGLKKTSKIREYINSSLMNNLFHDPVEGDDLIYPFLVIEAKRERNAPGFRSVERQTAFPIRRLLRVQEDLRRARQSESFDPLVWFFANQGEEWRVYAATMHNGKSVRILCPKE
jgi:hypothetical protein